MFSIITLLGDTETDKYYTREIFRRNQNFNRLFRLFDIREYRSNDNVAEITILDRFAMYFLLFYEGLTYENLIERLAGTKNLVFMTSDLHYWSIFPHLVEPEFFGLENLNPSINSYDQLFDMFDRLNVRHLIANYDCPELKQIQSLRPSLATYVLSLHFDPNIFKDYELQKSYDLIIYGTTLPKAYPFRHRVCHLIKNSSQFNVLQVEMNQLWDPDNCGEGLSRKINQSRLGLATLSNFDYLVGKYFEIPASRTVVLGNINEQGRAIFGDYYIHIDDRMTDDQIINVIADALEDRDRLQEYADQMYRAMHTDYTLSAYERKLAGIAQKIQKNCRI